MYTNVCCLKNEIFCSGEGGGYTEWEGIIVFYGARCSMKMENVVLYLENAADDLRLGWRENVNTPSASAPLCAVVL